MTFYILIYNKKKITIHIINTKIKILTISNISIGLKLESKQ